MEEDTKVKRFSGKPEDYTLWKREFLAKLTIRDLAKYLQSPFPGVVDPKDNVAVASHIRKLGKTYSYIMLAVDERTADAIEVSTKLGDAPTAWKVVRDLFERTDTLSMANARAELYKTKLEEEGDIEEYLSSIHKLKNQIRAGEGQDAITDGAVISVILSGLPSSFRQWVYAKNAISNPKLSDIERELRAIYAFESRRARWRRMRKTLLLQLPETTSLKVVELIQIKRKGEIRKNMGEANPIGLIMNVITVVRRGTGPETVDPNLQHKQHIQNKEEEDLLKTVTTSH